MRLVDVEKAQQLAALAAYVPNLHEGLGAQRLLNLEVVVEIVRRPEVGIDAEYAAGGGRGATERRGGNDLYARHDRGGARREGEHRAGTAGVAFKAVRSAVARTVVEERVGVGRVKEQPASAANHESSQRRGLIAESKARAEAVPVAGKDLADVLPLEGDARRSEPRTEHG